MKEINFWFNIIVPGKCGGSASKVVPDINAKLRSFCQGLRMEGINGWTGPEQFEDTATLQISQPHRRIRRNILTRRTAVSAMMPGGLVYLVLSIHS